MGVVNPYSVQLSVLWGIVDSVPHLRSGVLLQVWSSHIQWSYCQDSVVQLCTAGIMMGTFSNSNNDLVLSLSHTVHIIIIQGTVRVSLPRWWFTSMSTMQPNIWPAYWMPDTYHCKLSFKGSFISSSFKCNSVTDLCFSKVIGISYPIFFSNLECDVKMFIQSVTRNCMVDFKSSNASPLAIF